jgi:hypothetical protein
VRGTILAGALTLIALLGGLTIVVAVRNGPDPLTLLALLVLAMLGFGILGALREGPPRP